jgi:hypothetical protein
VALYRQDLYLDLDGGGGDPGPDAAQGRYNIRLATRRVTVRVIDSRRLSIFHAVVREQPSATAS